MAKVKLLDCTLRDGGYVNNWNFGSCVILNILSRLNNSGIDYIEIGFIDETAFKDLDRTIYPNTDAIDEFFCYKIDKKAKIFAMVNFGRCSIESICHKQDSFLDGIRVMFKKEQMDDALHYCSQIQDKGYKVFVQPVSITNYSDEEMLELVKKVNQLTPYALCIVDTYGLLKREKFIKYFNIMNNNLDSQISIGYHSHNNFQLTVSNAIELLNFDTQREIIWDGSIYGMGKGAGNANIEMFAMYLNHNYSYNYDVNELFEIINTDIMPLYTKYNWGYSLIYYLAGLNDCHPDYVKYLQEKSLSVEQINKILKDLDSSKKLAFDKNYIEKIYSDN